MVRKVFNLSGFYYCLTIGDFFFGGEGHVACSGKIALGHIIGSLAIRNIIEGFGDHKVKICIALTMRVRDHVYRHAINAQMNIGAMIDVKAP